MMPEMRRFHEAVDYSLVALPARCSKPVAGFQLAQRRQVNVSGTQ